MSILDLLDDPSQMALQKELGNIKSLSDLLKFAGKHDGFEENYIRTRVKDQILAKFEKGQLYPEITSNRKPTMYESLEVLKLVRANTKGVVYNALIARMDAHIEKRGLESEYINDYLYLFSGYYPMDVSGSISSWGVSLKPQLKEFEMHQRLIKPAEDLSVREKQVRQIQAHGEKLEITNTVDSVQMKVGSSTALVLRNRIEEDANIEQIIEDKHKSGEYPIKMVEQTEFRGQGSFSFELNSEGEELLFDAGPGVGVSYDGLSGKGTVSYSVSVGKSSFLKLWTKKSRVLSLKFSGVTKGEKEIVRGTGPYPFIYSTDLQALKQPLGTKSNMEIEHNRGAEIVNLLRILPPPDHMLQLRHHKSAEIQSLMGDPRLGNTYEDLFKFLRAFANIPKRQRDLELILSLTHHPNIRGVGKLMFLYGFQRTEDEIGSVWRYTPKTLEKMIVHSAMLGVKKMTLPDIEEELKALDTRQGTFSTDIIRGPSPQPTITDRMVQTYREEYGASEYSYFQEAHMMYDFLSFVPDSFHKEYYNTVSLYGQSRSPKVLQTELLKLSVLVYGKSPAVEVEADDSFKNVRVLTDSGPPGPWRDFMSPLLLWLLLSDAVSEACLPIKYKQ